MVREALAGRNPMLWVIGGEGPEAEGQESAKTHMWRVLGGVEVVCGAPAMASRGAAVLCCGSRAVGGWRGEPHGELLTAATMAGTEAFLGEELVWGLGSGSEEWRGESEEASPRRKRGRGSTRPSRWRMDEKHGRASVT